MANIYKNAQFDLTTTNATDVYTVPSNSRAIVQNIHMANIGVRKRSSSCHIYDNSATHNYFCKAYIAANEFKSVSDGLLF